MKKKCKSKREKWEQVLHICKTNGAGALVVIQQDETKEVRFCCLECREMYRLPMPFPIGLDNNFITLKRNIVEKETLKKL